jgi:hypothetical protein
MQYTQEIDEEALFDEPVERPSNIPMPKEMSYLLFGAWGGICLVGFATIFLMKLPMVGTIIIALPTFLIMIIKPTFALCVMMLILPTGAGVGIPGVFSLDRGVAIAVAISFLMNIMISQPDLRIRNKALWVLVGYTVWVSLISLTSPLLQMEMLSAFSIVQILFFVFIVHWILETNDEIAFRWVLRSYVLGALGVIAITYMTGAAMQSMEEKETGQRFAATIGRAIDSNMLSVLIGLAFLAAAYLMVSDRAFLLRIIYFISMVIFPIMMIKTGSRGGLMALFITIISPFLFLKQVLRRPVLVLASLLVMLIGMMAIGLLAARSDVGIKIKERLTSKSLIQKSYETRKEIILESAKTALIYPMGTTRFGWLASHAIVPHNDFFYILGIYGIPGAAFFTAFIIVMIYTVRRIPFGPEKLYSRAILTYLLVSGLSLGQIGQKHYWIFMIIAMACERMAHLKNQAFEYIESSNEEEASSINY